MRTPTWVLGYHGCDREVGEAVLAGETTLRPSENDWDWLGTGITSERIALAEPRIGPSMRQPIRSSSQRL